MTDCNQRIFAFQALGTRKVEADFKGGNLSPDGGVVLLREVDSQVDLIDKLVGCFCDYRVQRQVKHSVAELLRQRIFAMAMGYEDLNDHDTLRCDPVMAMGVGKEDPLGLERSGESKGRALAGKSTLNRLELTNAKTTGVEAISGGLHKIRADFTAIENLLVEFGVRQLAADTSEVVLDFDATDSLLHGEQEGEFFQGYYDAYCYLPPYCEFYCARGDMENRIKEQQLDMFADRMSCAEMSSNQLRLWFSTFAYNLMIALRERGLSQSKEFAKASPATIRERLLKIATMVRVSVRRVLLRWSSSFRYQEELAACCGWLRTASG